MPRKIPVHIYIATSHEMLVSFFHMLSVFILIRFFLVILLSKIRLEFCYVHNSMLGLIPPLTCIKDRRTDKYCIMGKGKQLGKR